eukprot:gene8-9_t
MQWLLMKTCVQSRRTYIDKVKRRRLLLNLNAVTPELALLDTVISQYEAVLPLHTLIVFRQLAAIEMLEVQQKELEKSHKAVEKVTESGKVSKSVAPGPIASSSSWWSTFSRGKNKNAVGNSSTSSATAAVGINDSEHSSDADDVSLEQVQHQFFEDDSVSVTSELDASAYSFHVAFHSAVQATLAANNKDVLELLVTLSAEAAKRAGVLSVHANMGSFTAEDKWTQDPVLPMLLKVSTDLESNGRGGEGDQAAFQLIYNSADKGDSSVEIRSLPLYVAWNDPCIQQLCKMFIGPPLPSASSTPSAITTAGLQSTVKQVTARDLSSLKLKVDISAPKIIIPELVSGDCGFLFVDVGQLGVTGEQTVAGLNLDVKLEGISVALPKTLAELYSACKVRTYVVRPFDIETVVKVPGVEGRRADMVMDMTVTTGVKADVSPGRIASLMRYYYAFMLSMTVSPTPVTSGHDLVSPGGLVDMSRVTVVNKDADVLLARVSTDGKGKATDDMTLSQSQPSMLLTMQVPLVAVVMKYSELEGEDDSSPGHMFIAGSNLKMDFVSDAYDSKIRIVVNSVSVQDSERTEDQRNLLWTPPNTSIFEITYLSCYSSKSPLYHGVGTEVGIRVSDLGMSLDEVVLRRLQPYVAVLLADHKKSLVSSHAVSVSEERVRRLLDQSTLEGMQVDCSVNSLSLELMRIEAPSPSALSPTVASSTPNLRKAVLRITARDLLFSMRSLRTSKINMSVFSFSITDLSDSRSDYVIREAFCKHRLRVEDARSDNVDDTHEPQLSSEKEEVSMLVMQYESGVKSSGDVLTMHVSDIAGYASVDMIVDFVDILYVNFKALNFVFASPQETVGNVISNHAVDESAKALPSLNSVNKDEQSSLHVVVRVSTRHILLIEDPTSSTSGALVLELRGAVQFSEVQTLCGRDLEDKSSTHLALESATMSVLSDMSVWKPVPVTSPMSVDLHWSQTSVRAVPLSVTVALDTDTIDVTLSLNDLLLIHSLLIRARVLRLTDSESEVEGMGGSTAIRTSAGDAQRAAVAPLQMTEYSVGVRINTIGVTLINDMRDQDTPFLRILVAEADLSMKGFTQQMDGSGKVAISVDFHNPNVGRWEPILETWTSDVGVIIELSKVDVTISSSRLLQLNFSGVMFRTLLETFQQVCSFEENRGRKELAPAVEMCNNLGVGVEIFDSDSNAKLVDLPAFSGKTPLPFSSALTTGPRSIRTIDEKHSTAVDVVFSSNDQSPARQSINKLPVIFYRSKAYDVDLKAFLGSGKLPASVLEPVVEEILENQRYDPIRGWREPYLPMDPATFTDIHCNREMDMDSIVLPPGNKWRWQDNWKVDMRGKEGTEFDKQGWDYGVNFTVLSSSKKRRNFQPFDCVRRRRWIRTRVPVEVGEKMTVENRPWRLFWDTKIQDNGSRLLALNSRITILNVSSFPLTVYGGSVDWEGDLELCVITPNQETCVPITHAHASTLRFRPTDVPVALSEAVSTATKIQDYTKDITIRCSGGQAMEAIYSRIKQVQRGERLFLLVSSAFVIYNMLPCELRFRSEGSRTAKETGSVEPGEHSPIIHIDPGNNEALVSFSCGKYDWTESIPLLSIKSRTEKILFRRSNSSPGVGLEVCVRYDSTKSLTRRLIVYGECALVNRTDLDICVLSNAPATKEKRRYFRKTNRTFPRHYEQLDNSDKAPVRVEQLQVISFRRYLTGVAGVGETVYTDRDWKWSYMPPSLLGSVYLSTPFDDRWTQKSQLASFTISNSAIVVILFEENLSRAPVWIRNDKYQRLSEHAVLTRSGKPDFHFEGFAKLFLKGERVVLGGNAWRECKAMYVVFIIDAMSAQGRQMIAELGVGIKDVNTEAKLSWIEGANGVTLFSPIEDKMCIGVKEGTVWSPELPVPMPSASKGRFEIEDSGSGVTLLLAYQVSRMAGVFSRTKVITIMPHYCIVNAMSDPVYLKQDGDEGMELVVDPWQFTAWHKSGKNGSTELKLRCKDRDWGVGLVDINEVGSTVLLLPAAQDQRGLDPLVLHIEVRQAAPSEHCSMVVVVGRSSVPEGALYSVKNDSPYPAVIRQKCINLASQSTLQKDLFDIHVLPGSWAPLGMARNSADYEVLIALGTSFEESFVDTVAVNLKKYSSEIREFQFKDNMDKVTTVAYLRQEFGGRGRVVRIAVDSNALRSPASTHSEASELCLRIQLPFVCASVIAERPIRRELFNVILGGVRLEYQESASTRNTDFVVRRIQIDNYSETAVDPVLLLCVDTPHKKGEIDSSENLPAFQLCAIESTSKDASSAHFEYIGVRLLELAISVDSGTIEIITSDLLGDLVFQSPEDILARENPEKWMRQFTTAILPHKQRRELVMFYSLRQKLKASKIYFNHFILHPLKSRITFTKSSNPRGDSVDENAYLAILNTVPDTTMMPLGVSSFIVTDAFESRETLINCIIMKTTNEVQGQLGRIVGSYLLSLDMLGRPAGLLKNIGNGVQDFFYEPYEGLMQSPKDFLVGLSRGTGSLVTSVVGGALHSTVTIVGSASSSISKGFTFIGQDEDYAAKKALEKRRRDRKVAKGGVLAGLQEGGGSFVSGFTDGISGLVTRPMDEARKDGALGFMKGVGLGVLGVAVKPVIGVTDAIGVVAQGMTTQKDDAFSAEHARPQRALERIAADANELFLTPLNIAAARAQDYVLSKSSQGGYADSYVGFFALDGRVAECVFFSEIFVYLVKGNVIESIRWLDISKVYRKELTVYLESYGSEKGSRTASLAVPLTSNQRLREFYSQLQLHAYRMGNPRGFADVETQSREALQSPAGPAIDSKSATEYYVFGSANNLFQGQALASEDEVLRLSPSRLKLVSQTSPALLDAALWRVVYEWDATHTLLNSSRCAILAILNRSQQTIQITKTQLREGRDVVVFGAQGYDAESRSVLPGGCVVVFAYGYLPTLVDKAHVKVDVGSKAFNITFSTRANRSTCEPLGGKHVGFLEKSLTDWWA